MKLLQSEQETHAFGAELGAKLKSGDILGLVGQLGAGKTHFTQGIVEALGSGEAVTSPTFTLVNEYHEGRLPIFHFDFYRMEEAEEVIKIGWEEFIDEPGVIIVEWADKFPELMPEATVWWKFEIAPDGSRSMAQLAEI